MVFVSATNLFQKPPNLPPQLSRRCPRTATSTPTRCVLLVPDAMKESQVNSTDRIYLRIVEPERRAFQCRRSLLQLQTADEALTLAFFLFMSARGIRMTRKVEEWIRRAGQRCKQLDMDELGEGLLQHSLEEADHDKMYEQDTRRLSARWNLMFPHTPVDAERLIKADYLNPAEYAYHELHENVIESSQPFLQIAIAHEIERLSVVAVPSLLKRFQDHFSEDALKDLSFLKSHHDIDIHHTEENELQMAKLFNEFPDAAHNLARTGAMALRAFGDYMDECLVLANELVHRCQYI